MLKKLCLLLSLTMIASNLHCGDAQSKSRDQKALTANQIRRAIQKINQAKIARERGFKAFSRERTLAIKDARKYKHDQRS